VGQGCALTNEVNGYMAKWAKYTTRTPFLLLHDFQLRILFQNFSAGFKVNKVQVGYRHPMKENEPLSFLYVVVSVVLQDIDMTKNVANEHRCTGGPILCHCVPQYSRARLTIAQQTTFQDI
jgi:hypothetical protein